MNAYLASIPGPAWKFMEDLVNTPREEVNRIWSEARKKSAAQWTSARDHVAGFVIIILLAHI